MAIIYRTGGAWGAGKGGPLSSVEIDLNFYTLVQAIAALEASPPAPVEIDHFAVDGTQFRVHMSDGSVLGPYTLPKQTVAPPAPVDITDVTLTLGAGHADKFLTVTNVSGCVVTIPTHASVAIAIGAEFHFCQDDTAGAITFAPSGGVTLKKRTGREAATDTPGAVVTLKKLAINTWRVFGDLAVSA